MNAKELPVVVLYISGISSRRAYSIIAPDDHVSADTSYYDGSRYVGDGRPFGADAGIIEQEARIESFGSLTQNTSINFKNIIGSFSSAELGAITFTLDNKDEHFSAMFGDDLGESFLNQTAEIIQGFQGLAYGDYIPLFRGTIIDEQLDDNKVRLTAEALSSTLYESYILTKADIYSSPSQSNDVLPLVFGDCTENTGEQGIVKAPCIDTGNDVYCLAGHPILSSGNSITLYDDDGAIDAGDYTVTYSGDYESTGITIAYVTFSVAPTGDVFWKGSGAVDSSGTLITNPVKVCEKILSLAGDSTAFDDTSYAIACNHSDDQGFTCAGVIIADNPLAYHLTDVLSSFLGSWFINAYQEIVIKFDTNRGEYYNTAGVLRESREKLINGTRSRSNIINQPAVDYGISFAKIDRRYKNDALTNYLQTNDGSTYVPTLSYIKYGYRKPEPSLSFNWTRNDTTIATIQQHIVDYYADPLWIYTWNEIGLDTLYLEPGDTVLFSWRQRRDSNGDDLANQIGRIMNVRRDLDNFEMGFTFYDTGNYLLSTPDTYNGTRYVGDGLTFGGDRDTGDVYA
jgi:hypothetical protein